MAHLAPTTTACTAEHAARLFFDNVVRLHGVPKDIVSDRDTRFTSKFWGALSDLLGVKLRMSTAYHPQTDGQTERTNRTLGDMLRNYAGQEPTAWDTHLSAAEFALNNAVNRSTGRSPFFLNYGFHPALPIWRELDVNVPAAKHFAQSFVTRLTEAKASLEAAQQRTAEYYNRNKKDVSFASEQLVMLSTKNLRKLAKGPRKLLPRWTFLKLTTATLARRANLPFFGVQGGMQCWGGNDLVRATSLGSSSNCNTKCSGDSTKICGGSLASNVYSLSNDLGCFTDNATRMLPTRLYNSTDAITPQICGDRARNLGLKYYGVQAGYACFAGNDLVQATSLGPSTACVGAPCTGDGSQNCGGHWANRIYVLGDVQDGPPNLALGQPTYASSVYLWGSWFSSSSYAVDGVTQYFSTLSTNAQFFHSGERDPMPWFSVDLGFSAAVSRVVIWNRCDCCPGLLQNAEVRIGDVAIAGPGDTSKLTSNPLVWTQSTQLGLCAPLIITFNTHRVGRWVTIQNENPASDGYLQLTELQVFGFGLDFCAQLPCGDAPCTNLDTTWTCGTCPSYTVATTTTIRGAKGPACKGYDAGYYLGCFNDNANRMLPTLLNASRPDMTPALCATLARRANLPFFGVQGGMQCWGGNDLVRATSLGSSSNCNTKCSGDSTKICGGSLASNVYSLSFDLGCFTDNATRMLPTRLYNSTDAITPQICGDRARNLGLKYYGVQAGYACFAGNDLVQATSLGPSTACVGAPCTGDGSQNCGGHWANRIYALGASFACYPKTDIAGIEIRSLLTANMDACRDECFREPTCIYSVRTAGVCYLKRNPVTGSQGGNGLNVDADSACWMRANRGNFFCIDNWDVLGDHSDSQNCQVTFTGYSLDQCAAACQASTSCQFFVRQTTGHCYLKKNPMRSGCGLTRPDPAVDKTCFRVY
ncbi:hypothetical protein PLESTM_000219700 [Pleodorina starrii]|nr:hypothetical protein PLESTM_000219700 [Pleodorina starrii]